MYLLEAAPTALLCRRFGSLVFSVVVFWLGAGMDGPTLAQRLLGLRPGIKVLFMSGYSEEAVARGGVLEEGAGFLQKPAKPDELTRAVRRILDRQASA